VFVRLPAAMARAAGEFGAYPPDEVTGLVRLMCSWDTTDADVDALLAALDGAREPAALGRAGQV
jgi:threonine aldolase